MARCDICQTKGEVKHLDLFTGLDICSMCETELVNYVCVLKRTAARSRDAFRVALNELREELKEA